MERRQLDLHERDSMHIHFNLAKKEMKRSQTESNKKILSLEKQNSELKESTKAHSLENRTEINELKSQLTQANNLIKVLQKSSAEKDLNIISFKNEIQESTKTLSNELKAQFLQASNKIQSTVTNETNELKEYTKDYLLNNQSDISKLKSQLTQANNKIKNLEKSNADKDLRISSVKNEFTELNQKFSKFLSGRLEWKIGGVRKKIKKKESTFSDPFYIGLYKCQVKIVWDYDNTGKVGCFICIMKGEFDDKLKWPFIFRYKFVLLNQNRNEDDHIWSDEITKDILQKFPQCFQRSTEIRNRGIGTDSFISHTAILEEKYCKEDSISLHITVEQLPSFYP